VITFSYNDPSDDNQNYPNAVAILQNATQIRTQTPDPTPGNPDIVSNTCSFVLFIYKTAGKGRRNRGVLGRLDYVIPAAQYQAYLGRAAMRNVAAGFDIIEFQCEAFAIATSPALFAGAVQS